MTFCTHRNWFLRKATTTEKENTVLHRLHGICVLLLLANHNVSRNNSKTFDPKVRKLSFELIHTPYCH